MSLSEWLFIIMKSINLHFDGVLTVSKYFIGEKRLTSGETTWCEIRVNGPHFTPRANNEVLVEVVINALICTKRDEENIYTHVHSVADAMNAFTLSIPLLDENGDVIICLDIDATNEPTILVNHYGEVAPSEELIRSTIEATYNMEVKHG
jgi:hypothetical protein